MCLEKLFIHPATATVQFGQANKLTVPQDRPQENTRRVLRELVGQV